jgi:hypothetical protein
LTESAEQEVKHLSKNSSRLVPEAEKALEAMKYEIAGEIGVNLRQDYNGELTARDAGYIGGYMVKKMIDQAEKTISP